MYGEEQVSSARATAALKVRASANAKTPRAIAAACNLVMIRVFIFDGVVMVEVPSCGEPRKRGALMPWNKYRFLLGHSRQQSFDTHSSFDIRASSFRVHPQRSFAAARPYSS